MERRVWDSVSLPRPYSPLWSSEDISTVTIGWQGALIVLPVICSGALRRMQNVSRAISSSTIQALFSLTSFTLGMALFWMVGPKDRKLTKEDVRRLFECRLFYLRDCGKERKGGGSG